MTDNQNFEDSFIEDDDIEWDTFSFYYTASDGSRELEAHIQLPEDEVWPRALENFLDFLSSVYGYDIRKDVAVRQKSFIRDGWSGPTFDLSVQERTKAYREWGEEAGPGQQLELNFGGTD